jgi:hypothetical protein
MTPFLDLNTLGEKVCLKNEAETDLYGSISLYTNHLKAERSKMNQMEATFHDTITGLEKSLVKKSAQIIKQKPNSMAR